MAVTLYPFRVDEFVTSLNEREIGEVLEANVLTGFTFFDYKPYYGAYTSYGFSVRRTRGRLKKQSVAPGIEGLYVRREGGMHVTLSLRPHPVQIGVFAFFFVPMILFWVLALPDFFRTRDSGILLTGLVPGAVLYGILWLVFQAQSSTDLMFWRAVLRLREIRPHPER